MRKEIKKASSDITSAIKTLKKIIAKENLPSAIKEKSQM